MVGNFNDNGLNVNNLHPDNGNDNVWASPLVVTRNLTFATVLLFVSNHRAFSQFLGAFPGDSGIARWKALVYLWPAGGVL